MGTLPPITPQAMVLRLLIQQLGPLPRVMLPQQHLLVINELCTLRVHNLPPEVFVLEQVKEVQAHGILEILGVLRLFPVEQVVQVVDERFILQIATLGEEIQVVGIGKTLHKLELNLEAKALLIFRLWTSWKSEKTFAQHKFVLAL